MLREQQIVGRRQQEALEAMFKLLEEKHQALDGNLAKLQQVRCIDAEKSNALESGLGEMLQNVSDRLRRAETEICELLSQMSGFKENLELLSQMSTLREKPKRASGMYEQSPTPQQEVPDVRVVSRGSLWPVEFGSVVSRGLPWPKDLGPPPLALP